MKKDLLILAGVVAAFVVGGVTLVYSGLLPEQNAKNFNALSNISLNNTNIVIKTPTADDNTYIYAINPAAKQAWEIAKKDSRVQDLLVQNRGSAITIAAVQPNAFVGSDGKIIRSGSGQVIITANKQLIDGQPYTKAESFSAITGKQGESHQRIWNVLVDMNMQTVIDITGQPERVISEPLRNNIIYTAMNVFLPDAVITLQGSTVKWINISNLPHNVVGKYKSVSGSMTIDSGFFKNSESFQYKFGQKGAFEYHCTIHSEEGMKGRIQVS